MAAVLMLAAALIAWPGGPGAARLRELKHPAGDHRSGHPVWARALERLPVPVVVPVVVALIGLVFAGPLQGCAAAILAATVVDLRRRAFARRGELAALAAWDRALDEASSALRAGSAPGTALRRAADAVGSAGPDVASVLTSAAAHADLGGDVATAFRPRRGHTPVEGGAADTSDIAADGYPGGDGRDDRDDRGHSGQPSAVWRIAGELSGAWRLATRHGVVLAEVVDGLRADVASRRERALRVDSTLAGPRATAMILTGLPAFGMLLGSGFGADPLAVLLDGTLGGALSLAGAVLLAAGLMWTDRIAGGAAR